jgi:AraC-like DNA-binding protein
MRFGEHLARASTSRTTLRSSAFLKIEKCFVSPVDSPPSGFERSHQLVLPYHGLFGYNVGSKEWLIDTARILCIDPGWEFRDQHPIAGLGHGAILITPTNELLEEVSGTKVGRGGLFPAVSMPNPFDLQLLTHTILNAGDGENSLMHDELAIKALRKVVTAPRRTFKSSNLVNRAKELIHAHGCDRLTLDSIARRLDTHPAYLTQEFTRSEGIPLYQYQLRCRLQRALLELPHCSNITGLAFELGFSSHSHFTSLFGRAFGMTPSQYRDGDRARTRQVALVAASDRWNDRRKAA